MASKESCNYWRDHGLAFWVLSGSRGYKANWQNEFKSQRKRVGWTLRPEHRFSRSQARAFIPSHLWSAEKMSLEEVIVEISDHFFHWSETRVLKHCSSFWWTHVAPRSQLIKRRLWWTITSLFITNIMMHLQRQFLHPHLAAGPQNFTDIMISFLVYSLNKLRCCASLFLGYARSILRLYCSTCGAAEISMETQV